MTKSKGLKVGLLFGYKIKKNGQERDTASKVLSTKVAAIDFFE